MKWFSTCKYCHRGVQHTGNEWIHMCGSSYCRDDHGFTATPLHHAEPVLETEVL